MSVYFVRAFDQLREMALTNKRLARKVDQLEKRISDHDDMLIELVREILQLIETPKPKEKKHSISFIISDELKKKA